MITVSSHALCATIKSTISRMTARGERIFPPFSDRACVQRIVPVRVEAKAAAEAGFPAELMLGHAFNERDQPAVNGLPLPEHVGQRQTLLLLGSLGVESVDAAVCHRVAWRPPSPEISGSASGLRLPGVTCAMMSLTDQAPVTPGSSSRLGRPAWDCVKVRQLHQPLQKC